MLTNRKERRIYIKLDKHGTFTHDSELEECS
jgi:hypothetical protein